MTSGAENPFLSREGVERIARLARLRLDPGEAADIAPKLEHVLAHIERIAEIPDAELPEAAAAPATPLRDDVAVPDAGREELLRNAAVTAHGLVPVPRVVDASR
ncbi:MAG TPA: Asp-tRNA(Asn)/Glu-tRNA(Gln) amidotransferase subunit GatC [Thermoanaerobaculia bacterium]|nr:Asp-tRNA(Asn)/Glu-tRNA(Gln) amidotransferase subunit GatC [Thermoanaerobaculia bacterium]